MMRLSLSLFVSVTSFCLFAASCSVPQAPEADEVVTPDVAFDRLVAGNKRFMGGRSIHPRESDARRRITSQKGQKPFVSILTCSDSRVPPELIFDQGIGDVFAVRVAGNVADVDELGTLEYGAGHLKTPLIVVMGHTQCGAVTAVAKGERVGGFIPQLVDNIAPAVTKIRLARPGVPVENWINDAIHENVRQQVRDITAKSQELAELHHQHKLRIVGAVYDLDTGEVDFLEEQDGHTESNVEHSGY
ncbi:MAG: carbonic anhydrase [Spirochaetia bacterium]|nr:carbonic anhydrase [Spirochaetia bacterium]